MATYTGTSNKYNKAAKNLINGTIDLDTHSFGVLLATSTYVPNAATHEFVSSITNEVTGGGYARQVLTSVTLTEASAGVWMFDSADAVFTASGGSITAYYWVLFDDTPATDATKPLIAYGLLDNTPASVTATDGNSITPNIDAAGWFRVT